MKQPEEEVASPRLAGLQARLGAGDEAALGLFWQEIEARGTPLVEAEEGGRVLITLVWRHSPGTRTAAITGGLAGEDVAAEMKRLWGTDVWYLTREARDDLRATYQIAPDDPLTPLDDINTREEFLGRTAHWRPDPLNPRTFVHPHDPDNLDDIERVESIIELPAAKPYPWIERRSGVSRGGGWNPTASRAAFSKASTAPGSTRPRAMRPRPSPATCSCSSMVGITWA